MKPKRLPEILLFLILWLAFTWATGLYSHMHKLPMGVHQGAQCDRASLAQNFYYSGFRFLYPEVNEDRCVDGIVSCEMPLSSFLAACLYKAFGYSEFWFRLLSFVFLSIGMLAIWQLLRSRLSFGAASALILLLQASPLLLFYGPSFIPDTTSLGLVLLAWFLFFRLHVAHPWLPVLKHNGYSIALALTLGLAVAAKTTGIIQWLSMAFLMLYTLIPATGAAVLQRKKLIYTLAASLLIPVFWYFWSKHLAATHNSQYFMMRIPFPESMESYRLAWAVYLANWPPQVLEDPLIYIAVALLLLPLFLRRHIQKELRIISLVNAFGSISFLCLMMEQFKYHDYYAICLYPAFLLNWLALSDAIRKIKPGYWFIKLLLFGLLLSALNFQFHSGSKNLRERYTEGNYWEQSLHRSTDLDSFRLIISKAGVRRGDCAVAGYDPSPNNMLYLLHLRGHRFSKEHDDERLRHIIYGSYPKWLISNDSALSRRISVMCKSRLICGYKNLELYELKYP